MMRDYSSYNKVIYNIIGAAMAVQSELGYGLGEPIYNEALVMELNDRGLTAVGQKLLECYYKGRKMEKTYKADVVVDDVVVELKSCAALLPEHRSQLFNYLRLTHSRVGLLINFGDGPIQGERYVLDEENNRYVRVDRNMRPLQS